MKTLLVLSEGRSRGCLFEFKNRTGTHSPDVSICLLVGGRTPLGHLHRYREARCVHPGSDPCRGRERRTSSIRTRKELARVKTKYSPGGHSRLGLRLGSRLKSIRGMYFVDERTLDALPGLRWGVHRSPVYPYPRTNYVHVFNVLRSSSFCALILFLRFS